jgi:hypothetical protein
VAGHLRRVLELPSFFRNPPCRLIPQAIPIRARRIP